MMQDDPYAAFSVPLEPVAPIAPAAPARDPYSAFSTPVTAGARRPAAPRAAATPAPLAPVAAAPGASGGAMTDLGISQDDEVTALVRQGYSLEEARRFAGEPESMGYATGGPQSFTTPASGAIQDSYVDAAAPPVEWEKLTREQQLAIPVGSRVRLPNGEIVTSNAPAREGAEGREVSPGLFVEEADRQGYVTALQQERERADLLASKGNGVDFSAQPTAPINDELAGLVGFLTQGAANLGRTLTGQENAVSAADRAAAARDVRLTDQEAFEKENPMQALGGGILGGFAFLPTRAAGLMGPLTQAARQAANRQRVVQGLGQAGAVSAGYGVAEGEGVKGRLLTGAGAGALGLATAGLLEGGAAGVGGLLNRAPRAERRVSQVINRELRANRVTPQELQASMAAAPVGALPFNASDGLLAPVAEALVATTGPGGRITRQAVEAQRQAQPDRIMDRIGNEMGGQGDYFATLNNSIETRRTAAKTVIDEIGPQQYRPDETAVNALRSDYARSALETQRSLKANSPDPVTRAQAESIGAVLGSLGRDVTPDIVLDVRTAQDVSRALLDASSDAWRSGNGGVGQLLGDIGKAVRKDARDQVGAYDNWLTRYGDESSQIEALELGRRVFRNADDPTADGMSAEVLRTQFDEMSDTAKDMFRKGIAEAVVARTRTGKGEVGTMRDLLRTREFGDRIRIAFPDEQAFTRFMDAATDEVGLANAAQGILGNSNTARRQATMKRLGVEPETQAVDQLSQTTLTGIPLVAGRMALRAGGRAAGRRNSVMQNDELNELLGRVITEPALLTQMLNRAPRPSLLQASPAGPISSTQNEGRGLLTANP